MILANRHKTGGLWWGVAERESNGRFVKGHKRVPGSGRRIGQTSHLTAVIKTAVLETFDKLGREEWLLKLAKERPEVFTRLLEKVLPSELKLDPESALPLVIVRDYTTGVANGQDPEKED